MAEENNNSSSSETQRASDVSLQRSTPTEDAASQRDTAGEVHDPEKKRLHDEAASYRKRAKDLEAQLKVYQDAEKQQQEAALSEVERANKRAADAEQLINQYKQELVNAKVQLAAQSKGIIDSELAALAIQSSLEYGDDGMPTNIDQALTTLIKNKPYLAPKQEKPAEPAPTPETPAQTAQRPPVATPQIPAMNPGRSTIAAPNSLPPGRIPTLADVFSKRQ